MYVNILSHVCQHTPNMGMLTIKVYFIRLFLAAIYKLPYFCEKVYFIRL